MVSVPKFDAFGPLFREYARVAGGELEPRLARSMWRALDGADRQLSSIATRIERNAASLDDRAAGAELLRHLGDASTTMQDLMGSLPKRAPRSAIDGRPFVDRFNALADSIDAADAVVRSGRGIGVPTLPPPPTAALDDAAKAARGLDPSAELERLRLDADALRQVRLRPRIADAIRGALGGRLMQRMMRVKVIGAENIPREGGVVLATTHTGAADQATTLMGHARTPRIMAHAGLMKNPVARRLFEQVGAFPVEPGNAGAAIRLSKAHLLQGNAVKVYAEGMQVRVDRLAPAREGAAIAAIGTGSPIVVQGEYGTRAASQYGESVLRHWTHRGGRGAVAWSEPIPTAHLDPRNRDHVTALAARIGEEQQRLREVARAAIGH